MTEPLSRFRVVPRQPGFSGRGWLIAIVVAWLFSLVAVWALATWRAAPGLGDTRGQLRTAERTAALQKRQLDEVSQRLVTLSRSDQISRAANSELQSSLAERDEEIAALRADVAFYERLVGATAQRKGLNVHSIEFAPTEAGTWNYRVILTQNLNRGAISQGQLRFSVEGVRAGKLATVSWDDLHQKPSSPGQEYSFRYFQELGGNVMLPKDFTPQRVRVSLRGGAGGTDQTFDWKLAGSGGGR
ncbi:hypothetical protein MNQ95_04170 [Pseudoxanthomonas daejeonensis]|jgi:hypothetical protein|uniref:Transmembrane protein n=1 Tax=Pseudoxanthomonas daejeonensis TaxID=266062 RepID=A0ABQ6Z8J2_9GAMM|nr:DUF6776 family protein [Pseudoxanthomonas daejeonensis]KAF1695498.1 hypothetical protein CSC65_06965 [Pseudoxanthomonas daejeonensis]UNK58308.1 hypothetical protein MNQ95_04170 [Pseudoxanthomonas daejeonensis]